MSALEIKDQNNSADLAGWPIPDGGILPRSQVGKDGYPKRQMSEACKQAGWKPGTSGNPGGRPKSKYKVAELAREFTAEAIQTLAEIMRNPETGAPQRIAAANSLLDRGHGRAPLSVKIETGDGEASEAQKRVMEVLERAANAAAAALVGNVPALPPPMIQSDGSEILPPESQAAQTKTPQAQGTAAFVAGIAAGIAAIEDSESSEDID